MTFRRALTAAYAVYLAVVAFLVFTPGGTSVGGPIAIVLDVLHAIGVEASRGQVEVGLNVLLFVPLSLLGWFLVRQGVRFWVVAAAVLSVTIELVQLAIPGRTTSFWDVVANTSGAAVGALLALGWTAWGKRGR